MDARGKTHAFLAALGTTALVGAADFFTGYELSFSLFYLAPILLATWRGGRPIGVASAVLAAAVWYALDRTSGHAYSHPAIAYWNAAVRLGFFLTVALLFDALQRALVREQDLARVDPVTGAANRRHFREQVAFELARARRYRRHFTLACLDLDNFKSVNDSLGHAAGDEVLRAVAATIRQRLRRSDFLARLGGDEFALFLTETDQGAARAVIDDLRPALVERMRAGGWPVTFSIGVVSGSDASVEDDELMRQADELMYRVKRSQKDGVLYAELGAPVSG